MQFKVKGIISFPHLFTPRAVQQGDDPKYSVSCLIRKDDPQLPQIQQIVETEKANGFPSGFPHNGKVFLKDGATEYPTDPRMHNYMVISMNSGADNKPTVVDINLQPVMDPAQVYPGAMAWFSVNTNTYNMAVNKGVGAYINGVCITGEEGPLGRLDNKPTADQMFGDIAGGGAPAPQAAPQAPAASAAPTPPAPPAPPAAAPAAPQYQMTAKAGGFGRDQLLAKGWTDATLVEHGLMLPPNGVTPSFS